MNRTAEESLQLRDIHLPPSPDFWPPAPGWWLLALLLLVLMIWAGMIIWRRYRLHRHRKRLLGLLTELETSSHDNPQQMLTQLSTLLRRIALMHFPRKEVAALTGKEWLHFLDSSGGNGKFTNGPGRLLADGPYLRDLPEQIDTRALTSLVRDWIRTNAGA